MLLVERHYIKRNHSLFAECDHLSFLTKNLYNAANFLYRQDFFAGKITDASDIYHFCKNCQDYMALPSKVSQKVLRMLLAAWQSYHGAKREYKLNPDKFKAAPKIPNYKGSIGDRSDGRYVVSYNNQAISKKYLKKGIIHPSQTNIYLKTKVKTAKQVRIIPKKNAYMIEVVYEEEIAPIKLPKRRIAAIDNRLNNLATLSTNLPHYQPKIYDGRAIKSVNQYANKENACLQSQLKEKRTTSRIKKIFAKRNRKVDYYLHCTSKAIISELVRNQIGKLIIGWNPNFKDQINLGRVNNQKFVNIPHHRLIEQLKYKGIKRGNRSNRNRGKLHIQMFGLRIRTNQKTAAISGKKNQKGII